MHRNHRMPVKIVRRSRFRSTTDDDPSVDETPPPNRSDRPPPLPLCSSTSSIISRLVMMRTTEIAITTALLVPPGAFRGPACPLNSTVQPALGWTVAADQASNASLRYRHIVANSPASRLAPPTSAPSMSGCVIIEAMLPAFTHPPYKS